MPSTITRERADLPVVISHFAAGEPEKVIVKMVAVEGAISYQWKIDWKAKKV